MRQLQPLAIDVALAGAALIAGLAEVIGGERAAEPAWRVVPLAVAGSLVLVVRRRWPLTVLGAVLACALALTLGFGFLWLPFSVMLAVYTVAAHYPRPAAAYAGAAAAIALAPAIGSAEASEPLRIVPMYGLYAAAWILGDSLRTRRAYLRELEEKARRLEREREEEARRAVAEEQARIARELHDVIAHNVSVMVVQAAAGRDVFDAQPERAREALRSIEATGRSALAELRRLLGAIRQPGGPSLAPQPTLAELDRLLDQVRSAGLEVTARVDGSIADLPQGVDLSAYRIVQEALTNTLKHGRASTASVVVRRTAGGLEVAVSDDGVGANGNGASGGQGLIGMRERVVLFGGELRAGPGSRGGFEVRASFPLETRAGA